MYLLFFSYFLILWVISNHNYWFLSTIINYKHSILLIQSLLILSCIYVFMIKLGRFWGKLLILSFKLFLFSWGENYGEGEWDVWILALMIEMVNLFWWCCSVSFLVFAAGWNPFKMFLKDCHGKLVNKCLGKYIKEPRQRWIEVMQSRNSVVVVEYISKFHTCSTSTEYFCHESSTDKIHPSIRCAVFRLKDKVQQKNLWQT